MHSVDTTPAATGSSPPATLHMLCGKIAAGKSTLASRLAAQPGTVRINEDDWLSGLYPQEMHSVADYARYAERLRACMAPHIVALLRGGVSVVLDFPANTPLTRRWARAMFESAGAAHCLHFLDFSDEICKQRLHARNAAGNHPFATSDTQFDLITRHFVAPSAEEGFEVVRHG